MLTIRQRCLSYLFSALLAYLEKNPTAHVTRLLPIANRLIQEPQHRQMIKTLQTTGSDPENNWTRLINRVFSELSPNCRRKLLTNFLVNASLIGIPTGHQGAKKHGCKVPWAILMDPTAECNLRCKGCWAGEYDHHDQLEYDLLDRVICEGKRLGIYMYIYSGGEPLIRKNDLLKLATKHHDCMFLSFTNGTLIDQPFAKELARVGNIALALSIEGLKTENDLRRGSGCFTQVMKAMDTLKHNGIVFGFSTCYHRYNTETVASEEFVDLMISSGALFGWYFTYMPLGQNADVSLLAKPEQRRLMYERVRAYRQSKPLFLLDFWNDGEYSQGCIAGGRRYLHINAHGDVEPCAFIHYSNVNIRETSLIKALQSPLFMEYRKNQPFNENPLRPCPLLDNPHKLKEMVETSNAKSTQPLDQEDVGELAAKCMPMAKEWAKVADSIFYDQNASLPD